MKNIITVLLIIIMIMLIGLAFSGCEKTIDLKYKGNISGIIIESNITNEPGPYFVKITKSIALTDTANYPVVDNALVTIADDSGNNENLVPHGNGLYSTSTIQGEAGRTYTLTVKTGEQTYSAQSTLPARVLLDSVKAEKIVMAGDTSYNIIPVYSDPITIGNYYRFVLKLNGKLVNQQFVQNDQVKNGVVNTMRLEINDDDLKMLPGDRVDVEMQCIDKNVATYYTTLALISDSGPGGGTTPTNPPNNLSNGALGLFSAHTTENKVVIIP